MTTSPNGILGHGKHAATRAPTSTDHTTVATNAPQTLCACRKEATGHCKRSNLDCNDERRGFIHERSCGGLGGEDDFGDQAGAAWSTATDQAAISRMTDTPAGADAEPAPTSGAATTTGQLENFTLLTAAFLPGHFTVDSRQKHTPPWDVAPADRRTKADTAKLVVWPAVNDA